MEAGAGGAEVGGIGGEGAVVLTAVSGHIRSSSGMGLEGAVVTIGGSSVLTDATGAFVIDAVPARYDLTVIYENEQRRTYSAEVIDGLSTRELELRLWGVNLHAGSADVSGKIAVVPKGREALVQVAGERVGVREESLLAGSSAFALQSVQWEGNQASAELLALEWTPSKDGPVSYDGFARKSVELSDGAKLTGNNLTLTKPPQKTVTGSIFYAGSSFISGYLGLGSIGISLPAEVGPFSVVVPDIGEVPLLSVGFEDFDAGAWVMAPASSPLALEVPQAPELILPVNEAKITESTQFSFSAAQPIAAIWWTLGPWTLRHVTQSRKVTLPDLRSAGIDWDDAIAQGGMWVVESHGPAETPEAFLELMDGTSPLRTSGVTTRAQAHRALYTPPLP